MIPPRRLLEILTMPCEGASLLASKAADESLEFSERIALYGHLLACGPCRRFRDQLAFLREAHRAVGAPNADHEEGPGLSEEARARLTEALRAASERENGSGRP